MAWTLLPGRSGGALALVLDELRKGDLAIAVLVLGLDNRFHVVKVNSALQILPQLLGRNLQWWKQG